MRRRHPALTLGDFTEIDVEPSNADDYVFSFTRSYRQEHALVVINMGGREETVDLDLRIDELDLPDSEEYFLTNLMTGQYLAVAAGDPGPLTVTLSAYEAAPFLIADQIVEVSVPTSTDPELASDVALRPVVYPNPFSDRTVIQFAVDRPGRVTLTVFDLLGRSVASVVDGELSMGIHRIEFGARHLAPGAYLYRLEAGGRTESGMMIKSQ
ncbi:MAG TPA: T9SS type A sorting domain-containing protein [Rhodothermales bacterium]|nr:T9SS type A sorting domain-containing protein [Rhodothermales bacterium]